MKKILGLLLGVVGLGLLIGAENARSTTDAQKPEKAFQSVETKDLHNAYRVTDKLLSGAAPENEQAFKDLQTLGVKTIISVDGAAPDAEMAKKFGMQYVHLPITYSGVKEQEGKDIGKAIAELPGQVYLHCHHGKHRSAAAVAVACVVNGSLKPEQAESVLKTFGTGDNYLGLWKAARDAKPLEAKDLDAIKVDYVEKAKIDAFAVRMVWVDRHWDHLKSIQKNGWKAPQDHPDLDPAHEALQLQEHLRESARTADVAKHPAEFKRMLDDGEVGAAALHQALSGKPIDVAAAEASFKTVATSCTACHKAYRD